MQEIIIGVVLFTGIVMALAVLILIARSRLVPSGNIQIMLMANVIYRYRQAANCLILSVPMNYFCLLPVVGVAPADNAE